MTRVVERTIRLVDDGKPVPRPGEYWLTRSFSERLAATLQLHREGNELFRGGNPPFVFDIRTRDVERSR
jgi:hypothetical protein